ncbi:putative signal transduction protein with CBS domain containing protein [Alkalidesulfovibrio alkalitolerans DSM 16529]|uniref:Putative signal transduction protein with CBS domain containing protein n=1 Tax=Alkalidesulfovibrio alkalitolerans DSM 16529 TaxID=1121439 RepID=S7T311_9BACT|nr:hemolysin family protein [Alkalidesulfovibrio alkalitolerans]EPR31467.1 putative signal transduction protein with CBS domain containing protein [Alkalidesulfovibrio alkalitolerans DSM 16529]
MLVLILAVGLATLISFFCSLSEAALYSISWAKIEGLRREKRRSGDVLYELRQDIEKPISAILTLNTVANTAGASVAGAAAAGVFGTQNLLFFAIVFTVIILIFGEIIPKTIGVLYCRQVAPVLAWPIRWMVRVFSPVTWLLGFVVGFLKDKSGGPQTTEEDIKAIVSLTRKAGLLKPYEELSIRNILTLDKKRVEDVMTPRTVVFSRPANLSVSEAMREDGMWPHSRVPVWEDDSEDIVGLVYRREVLEALAKDRHGATLAQLMKPVEFILESLTLDRALIKFLESRTHLFVVLDEYGGFSGVITLEDVLEEILGKEIVDETDQVADMRELARRRRKTLTQSRS